MILRNVLILLFFFGITEFSFSQRLSVEVLAGTHLKQSGYGAILPNDSYYEMKNLAFGGMLGAQVEYKINDYISAGIGLRWYKLRFDKTALCFTCYAIDEIADFEVRKWDIPIYVRVFVLKQTNKIAPYASVGASNQLLKIEHYTNRYKFNWNLGGGFLFNLNEVWAIDTGVDFITYADNSRPSFKSSFYTYQDLILRIGVQKRFIR